MIAPPEAHAARLDGYLVDGHVHLYDCFDLAAFLDGAASNFRQAAAELRLGGGSPACLLFAETSREHYFDRLRAGEFDGAAPGWTFGRTLESDSLLARREDGALLVVIAGRQIVTKCGLEVLGLASTCEVPDGTPMGAVLCRLFRAGALPVLPWGFGKWWFRRGPTVEAILRSGLCEAIFLGDNGGRPSRAPRPRLFELARDRGVPVLPGSDPLPIPSAESGAGRYGFLLEGPLDLDRPAEQVRRALYENRGFLQPCGHRATLADFVRAQLALRFAHVGRPSGTAVATA